MTRNDSRRWTAWLSGLAALGLASGAQAQIASDALRAGGCSGCFNAQTDAAFAAFATVDVVVRGCATGGAMPDLDGCDGTAPGGTGGDLMDYIWIRGDLRNSTTDPNGLGVPGGATDVVYRVSANGSSNGIRCGNNVAPLGIGFLAPEGFDGLINTADDAGGDGAFLDVGNGASGEVAGVCNTASAGAAGTGADCAAPLFACDASVGDPGDEFDFLAGTVKAGGYQELCLVQYDIDGDAQIDNAARGATPAAGKQVGDTASSETFNLLLQCDWGLADLPTSDFADPALNTQSFDGTTVFGAQIFKMAASDDLHGVGDATEKIALNDAQIETLFSPGGTTSMCNWADVGGDAASTNDNVTLCTRNPGSGTKETFRNTWLTNVGGDATEATGTSTGTTTNCLQALENPPGGNRLSSKTVVQQPTNGDVVTCLENRNGAVGYVDAADESTEFYSVVVEGVDPDNNDLRLLTKCGMYRWWGPLTGGRPSSPGTSDRGNAVATSFENAHRTALQSKVVFATSLSYLPASGVAVTKNVTDGSYRLNNFAPVGCPAQPNPPIAIP
jgi:hypothetical protein